MGKAVAGYKGTGGTSTGRWWNVIKTFVFGLLDEEKTIFRKPDTFFSTKLKFYFLNDTYGSFGVN